MSHVEEIWFVDGYNVIHHLSRARGKRGGSTRENLLQALASFCSSNRFFMCVVLDGKGNNEELKGYETVFFRAVYSQGISADSYIERCLCEREAKRQTVVTNDRAIAQIARGLGAAVVSVDELMEKVKAVQKHSEDILFQNKVHSHRFHRPFEDKLKDIS